MGGRGEAVNIQDFASLLVDFSFSLEMGRQRDEAAQSGLRMAVFKVICSQSFTE